MFAQKSVARDSTAYIVKSLSNNWLEYNEEYFNYLPTNPANAEDAYYVLHQKIDLVGYEDMHTQVTLPSNSSLLINNKLVKYNFSSFADTLLLSNHSLIERYSHVFFLSIYNESGFEQSSLNLNITEVLPQIYASPQVKNNFAFVNIIRNSLLNNTNLDVIFFLFIVGLLGLLKFTDKEFLNEYVLNNINSSKDTLESYQMLNFFRLGLHLTIAVVSCLVGYIVAKYFDPNHLKLSILAQYCIYIYLIIVAKYFIIEFYGWLFNQQSISKIHFYDYLNSLLKLSSLLATGFFIFYLINPIEATNFPTYLNIIAITIFVILLMRVFYVTLKSSLHRNMYLFSYLCIIEILPTIFLIKYLLQ